MWSKESSTAVSVSTFIFLLFLWFFVSMPLVFVGSYFGFRAETYTIPVRVNQIARCVQQKDTSYDVITMRITIHGYPVSSSYYRKALSVGFASFVLLFLCTEYIRHVPEQMWYTHPVFAIALGGVLPFGAVCIELFFIMSALWLHQVSVNMLCSSIVYTRGTITPSVTHSRCWFIIIYHSFIRFEWLIAGDTIYICTIA